MKFKLSIAMIFIALVALGFGVTKKLTAKKTTPVKITVLANNSLEETLFFQGVVVPGESYPVYAEINSSISKILVKKGDEIRKGENLLELSITSKKDILQELEEVRLDLNNLDLQISDLSVGSKQVELEERKLEQEEIYEEIRSLKRSIEVIAFEAEYLKGQSEMMDELLEKKGISSVQANEAKSEANKKQLELEDLKTSLDIAQQKYTLSKENYQRLRRGLDINEDNIRGQRQKLLLRQRSLKEQLSTLVEPVAAPADGIITELDILEGSSITTGQRLLSIAPLNEYKIVIEVPINIAENIRYGQNATIITRSNNMAKEFKGRVGEISNAAKIITNSRGEERVIEVEIESLDDLDIKPGFLTEIEIDTTFEEGMKMVSSFSVIETEGSSYVYVLKEGRAEKVPVEIGAKTLSQYEILNLPEGTEIIVNPFKVSQGQRIDNIRR